MRAMVSAAIPDAQATLPTPPSSFVIRFSKASTVGLLILVYEYPARLFAKIFSSSSAVS